MYQTRLQRAMAAYDGKTMTPELFNKMKIDACLLIGMGITDKYYEKTFGPNGSVQTLEAAAKFANDAALGVGSFNQFAIRQCGRHKSKDEDK